MSELYIANESVRLHALETGDAAPTRVPLLIVPGLASVQTTRVSACTVLAPMAVQNVTTPHENSRQNVIAGYPSQEVIIFRQPHRPVNDSPAMLAAIAEFNNALQGSLFIARNTFEVLKYRVEPLANDE